jgi:hypothetical protein
LFEGILRFAQSGTGDVRGLDGDMAGAIRLRLGDYLVLFTLEDGGTDLRRIGEAHPTLSGKILKLLLLVADADVGFAAQADRSGVARLG